MKTEASVSSGDTGKWIGMLLLLGGGGYLLYQWLSGKEQPPPPPPPEGKISDVSVNWE